MLVFCENCKCHKAHTRSLGVVGGGGSPNTPMCIPIYIVLLHLGIIAAGLGEYLHACRRLHLQIWPSLGETYSPVSMFLWWLVVENA